MAIGMTARVVLGYREYAALPDDGRRYEILDGELSVTPAPSLDHQIILANLFRILDAHVRARNLGIVLFAPLDVILTDANIVQPDLVFLDHERMSRSSRRGVEGPPTLLVEVLSPGTTGVDRNVKRTLYAREGVPFYWIVGPEARTLEAFRAEGSLSTFVMRASGRDPCRLPPFDDLPFVVEELWESLSPHP
ncbi:MAG TPA: Uma2 family endonuclease [Methylomirabilota bacterium]|nr:Uma2 family endonuclease [Methylomirabilota bacterium]